MRILHELFIDVFVASLACFRPNKVGRIDDLLLRRIRLRFISASSIDPGSIPESREQHEEPYTEQSLSHPSHQKRANRSLDLAFGCQANVAASTLRNPNNKGCTPASWQDTSQTNVCSSRPESVHPALSIASRVAWPGFFRA